MFEDIIKNGRTAMVALPDAFFTPFQGSIPIEHNGQILGAVGGSGASTAEEGEELAMVAANALKTRVDVLSNVCSRSGEITLL